jgi:hypothetical protein
MTTVPINDGTAPAAAGEGWVDELTEELSRARTHAACVYRSTHKAGGRLSPVIVMLDTCIDQLLAEKSGAV